VKCGPVWTRLRSAIASLLIPGAMGTALVVANGTTSAPVNENECMSGGGNVHTVGTNASTVTAALVPARRVPALIPANMCSHPCDALHRSQTELCGELSASKDSPCMSRAADRHADCLSTYKEMGADTWR
jgi:hypothetical protein